MNEILKSKSFRILWIVFLICYIAHIFYCVSTYAIGTSACSLGFILDAYSNDLNIVYHDSFRSGFFIDVLLQLPLMLVYSFSHITDKFLYIKLFAFVQVAFPFIALIWNYYLTKRTQNTNLFLLNLLFLGIVMLPLSLNYDMRLFVLGTNFSFILWNYLSSDIEYNIFDKIVICLLSIVMISQHEVVAILGIIFFIASKKYIENTEDLNSIKVKKFIGVTSLIASCYTIITMLSFLTFNSKSVKAFLEIFPKQIIDTFRVTPICMTLLFSFVSLILICAVFVVKKLDIKYVFGAALIYAAIPLVTYLLKYSIADSYFHFDLYTTVPAYLGFLILPLIFLFLFNNDFSDDELDEAVFQKAFIITFLCLISQLLFQVGINNLNNIENSKLELILRKSAKERVHIVNDADRKVFQFVDGVLSLPQKSLLLSKSYKINTIIINSKSTLAKMNTYEYTDFNTLKKYIVWTDINMLHIYTVYRSKPFVYISDRYKTNNILLNVVVNEKMVNFTNIGFICSIKNKFWDLTDVVEALGID